jgi:hypothetical protein
VSARLMRGLRRLQRHPTILRPEFAGLLLLAGGMAGCAAYPIPLSAQAGSTIVIPLTAGEGTMIGFGGTAYTDYQRGTMIYKLDGAGMELTTRFSIAAEPHAASQTATVGQVFAYSPQIFSIVDIPANAPEGTHTLGVYRRLPSGGSDLAGPAYSPTIKILPNVVPLTGGGSVQGMPTPALQANCSGGCGIDLSQAIPRPRIVIYLQGQTWGTDNIAAFEMNLTYPASVIDIVDAYEVGDFSRAYNDTATVWTKDIATGTAHIVGIAHPDALDDGAVLGYWNLEVSFNLDNGAANVLLQNQLQATVTAAYDIDGNPVQATANIIGIR